MPVGQMSPLTAVTLVLASLALVLELPPLDRRWLCRQAASFLALAASAIGIIVLLSYVAGVPLLSGAGTIPMAVLTAVSVVMLGIGLSAGAGPDTIPSSLFHTASETVAGPSRHWRVVPRCWPSRFCSTGIGAVGYAWFWHQVAESRRSAQQMVSAIADMKVRQILKRREERLGAGRMISQVASSRPDLQALLLCPAGVAVRPELLESLKAILEQNEGLRILLLDRNVNVRAAYPPTRHGSVRLPSPRPESRCAAARW